MERELTLGAEEFFEMVVVCGRNPRQIPKGHNHVHHIHSVDYHLKYVDASKQLPDSTDVQRRAILLIRDDSTTTWPDR